MIENCRVNNWYLFICFWDEKYIFRFNQMQKSFLNLSRTFSLIRWMKIEHSEYAQSLVWQNFLNFKNSQTFSVSLKWSYIMVREFICLQYTQFMIKILFIFAQNNLRNAKYSLAKWHKWHTHFINVLKFQNKVNDENRENRKQFYYQNQIVKIWCYGLRLHVYN